MEFKIFSEKTAKVISCGGILLIVFGLVIFIVCGSWSFSWIINEEKFGQFGDFIGGVVGSLFAFVGVILYYVALTEQRKDIGINRETLNTQIKALNQQIEEFKAQTTEMQETREVYVEQTTLYRKQTEYYNQQVKELKRQTEIASLQQFNSEFYSLLNVFLQNKKDNEKVIQTVLRELKRIIQVDNSICDNHNNLIKKYIELYYENSNKLSIFFKTIYRLLKLIKDSGIKDEHKQQYAKILRSQLSKDELLILYYDYCSDLGEQVRILSREYNLLKYLKITDKLEFNICKFERNKVFIKSCLDELSMLFDLKIKQFSDIENEQDIIENRSTNFFEMQLNYTLQINDDEFVFVIEFSDGDEKYDKEDLGNLFLIFLYEYFSFSKFKKPEEDIFKTQIIENGDKFIIEYKSNINNLL